jgi:hypothetical protein
MSSTMPMSGDSTYSAARSEPTGWVGWITFAAAFMMIGGGLNAMYGLIAILNDEWVVWNHSNALLLDLTQWGWIHIVMGLVVFASGVGVLSGNIAARTVGVIAAGLSLITNFLFMPAYPLWSLTVMVIDTLIIWALIVHGHELRDL